MYKTVEIICFTEVFYVTAFGFVSCWCFFEGKLVEASINKSEKNKKQVLVLKSFLAMYCCLLVLLHVTCY